MKTYEELERENEELKAVIKTLASVVDDLRSQIKCQEIPQTGGVEIEFAFFIHPALTKEEAFATNETIKNAVKKLPLKDICSLLHEMEAKGKCLHGSATAVYDDLKRLGLQEGRGFSFKSFQVSY